MDDPPQPNEKSQLTSDFKKYFLIGSHPKSDGEQPNAIVKPFRPSYPELIGAAAKNEEEENMQIEYLLRKSKQEEDQKKELTDLNDTFGADRKHHQES